jgi:predicted Zn-dependent protease
MAAASGELAADISLQDGLEIAKQLAASGRLDDAEAVWTVLRERFPDQPQLYIAAAQQLQRLNFGAKAEWWLNEGWERFADDLSYNLDRAWFAYNRQDLAEAVRRWEAVRMKFPGHPAGHVGLAISLRDMDRGDEAEAILADARQRFPTDAGVAIEYASLAHRRRDWPEAILRWESVRANFPERSRGYGFGALALAEAGHSADADALLAAGARKFPDDLGIAMEFALLAHRRQDWAAARARWQQVRDRFPDQRSGYLLGARTLQSAGDPGAAVMLLADAMQRWPEIREVLVTAGDLAFERGDIVECIRLGKEMVGRFPNDSTGAFHLVRALRDSGRAEEAEEFLGDAPERYPGDAGLLSIWASLAMNRLDWPEAARRWEIVRQRFPDTSVGYIRGGQALQSAGRLEDADMLMGQAVARFPDNPELAILYARLAVARQDGAAARQRFESAAERFPTNAEVVAGLAPGLGDRLLADCPGSAGPDVAVAWSDVHIASLRGDLERLSVDTREYAFTKLQLDVARGDLAAARGRIRDVLNRYASFYPDDGYTFEALVVASVLASQWDLVQRFLNDRFGKVWCSGVTAEALPGPAHAIRWDIDADGLSRFCFDSAMIAGNRAWVQLVQFVRTLSLFYDYSNYSYAERGSVYVNLGDSGGIPGLAFCENRPEYFLVPDPVFLNSAGYAALREEVDGQLVPWSERIPRAFWRGATTGQRRGGWRDLQRVQLCLIAQTVENLMDVGVSSIVGMPPEMAAEAEAAGIRRPFVLPVDFMKFKYQIDVDGNTNAWAALFQKLYTGSPVLKVESPFGYRQWFYDALKPWRNYVPVAADMSDLIEKIEWLRANDDRARLIGERGRALAISMTHERELARTRSTVSAAIRRFAGHSETIIDFGRQDADAACLLEGWSEIDGDGRWAFGPSVGLRVPRPRMDGELILRFTLAPGGIGGEAQRVTVIADGQIVHSCGIDKPGSVECRIPAERPFTHDTVDIILLLPDTMTDAAARRGPHISALHFKELRLMPAEV